MSKCEFTPPRHLKQLLLDHGRVFVGSSLTPLANIQVVPRCTALVSSRLQPDIGAALLEDIKVRACFVPPHGAPKAASVVYQLPVADAQTVSLSVDDAVRAHAYDVLFEVWSVTAERGIMGGRARRMTRLQRPFLTR